MAETVDELTYDYEDEGVLVRKQIDKKILSKGAWATVMFQYADLDRKSGQFRAPKVAIVRFKKFNGVYRKQASFNISSANQAHQIVDVINEWFPAGAEGGADGEEDE
jgi:hypothetical protein